MIVIHRCIGISKRVGQLSFSFGFQDSTMTGKSWVSCDCVLEEIIAVRVLMARRAKIPRYRECSTKQFRDSGMDSIEIYCDRWKAEARCVLSEGNSGHDRKLRDTKLLSRPHTVAMFFPFTLGLAGWQAFLLRGDAYSFAERVDDLMKGPRETWILGFRDNFQNLPGNKIWKNC